MSASVRISAPAALLVVGVSLACSTACVTPDTVAAVQAPSPATLRSTARTQLVATVRYRGGAVPPPAIAADPLAIQAALAMALPVRGQGPQGLPKDTCDVAFASPEDARAVFVIRVRSQFGSYYAEAFLDYVEEVRRQIQPAPIFRVTLVDAAGHARSPRELR